MLLFTHPWLSQLCLHSKSLLKATRPLLPMTEQGMTPKCIMITEEHEQKPLQLCRQYHHHLAVSCPRIPSLSLCKDTCLFVFTRFHDQAAFCSQEQTDLTDWPLQSANHKSRVWLWKHHKHQTKYSSCVTKLQPVTISHVSPSLLVVSLTACPLTHHDL